MDRRAYSRPEGPYLTASPMSDQAAEEAEDEKLTAMLRERAKAITAGMGKRKRRR